MFHGKLYKSHVELASRQKVVEEMVVSETVVEGLIVEGTLVERSVKGRLDKLLRE